MPKGGAQQPKYPNPSPSPSSSPQYDQDIGADGKPVSWPNLLDNDRIHLLKVSGVNKTSLGRLSPPGKPKSIKPY
jgi:hypothetical protein